MTPLKNPLKNKTRQARPRRLRGRGDYDVSTLAQKDPAKRLEAKIDHLERSLVKKRVGNAASTVGRTLGNFLGQGDLGAMAGEGLAKLFGHGDYQIKGNSLMGSLPSGSAPPVFSRDGRRGTRITEREFLGDVYAGDLSGSSSKFDNHSYPLNPASATTFPWLSTIAATFEQWEAHGIVFEFISTSSEFNGTSQALGTVIMATDYDVLDAPYASKALMENADYACSTKPSQTLMHGIECEPSERVTKLQYTRVDSDASAGDLRFSNLGNFQLATTGCSTANVRLGELWVSYDVTLYKKQLNAPGAYNRAGRWTGTAALTSPLANPVVELASDIVLDVAAGVATFTFPSYITSGTYRLLYRITTSNALDVMNATSTGGSLLQNVEVLGASTATKHILMLVFRVGSPSATISLSSIAFASAGNWTCSLSLDNPDQRY